MHSFLVQDYPPPSNAFPALRCLHISLLNLVISNHFIQEFHFPIYSLEEFKLHIVDPTSSAASGPSVTLRTLIHSLCLRVLSLRRLLICMTPQTPANADSLLRTDTVTAEDLLNLCHIKHLVSFELFYIHPVQINLQQLNELTVSWTDLRIFLLNPSPISHQPLLLDLRAYRILAEHQGGLENIIKNRHLVS